MKVGEEETSAIFEPASAPAAGGALFVCAHGAGGHMADRGMLGVTEQLRRRGLHVVRFNFLYKEKGSRRPDPMPRLKECIAAVTAHARRETAPQTLILGGRSMIQAIDSVVVEIGKDLRREDGKTARRQDGRLKKE